MKTKTKSEKSQGLKFMLNKVGKYQVMNEIAKGGFATVYRAERDGRDYAIKVLYAHDLAEFMDYYLHEITINAQLKHPRIVPIIDYWYEETSAYMVMPYLSGGNLYEKIVTDGPLQVKEAARLLCQIADILHHLHTHGYIYQDIKPENIVFDHEGTVYMIDFGIAKNINQAESPSLSKNRCFLGSPRYVSPEQLRYEAITHRSDIYSLALLMYEVVTGYPAYDSQRLEELCGQHLHCAIPSLQSKRACLPLELNIPMRRASHKDPQKRFVSVLDFARDFLEIALKYA